MTKGPNPPEWDVFLSHNRADKARVRRLAKELTEQGLRVWFDEDAIPPGASIPLAVEEGIANSKTMILCLSPDFLENNWPQAERAAAQFADPANKGGSVLPVLFRQCQLPKLIGHLKYISYLRHTKKSLNEITQAVSGSVSRPPPPPSKVQELLDAAKDAERRQDLSEAARLATEALQLTDHSLDSAHSDLDRCRAGVSLSRYLLRLEETPEYAWELADSSADPAILEAYPEVLFRALCTKAEAALATRRLSTAEGALEAAAGLQDGAEDERIVEQVRGHLALGTERPDDAIRHFETARLSFAATLNNEPDLADRELALYGLAACLANLGVAHRQAGRLVGARAALIEAAEIYSRLNAKLDESAVRRIAAACHFDDREWALGTAQLNIAEHLARDVQNDAALVEALELRARVAATLERYEEARESLLEAIAHSEKESLSKRRRLFQMTATIHAELGDLAAANRALDTAYILAGDDRAASLDVEHQRKSLGYPRGNIGTEAAPDEILELLAQQIASEPVVVRRVELMRRLGTAHLSRQEFESSVKWFQRALDAARDARAMHLVVDAYLGLAQVAIKRDQDDQANRLLHDAKDAAENLPHWAAHVSITTLQALLSARRGDFTESLALLDSAHHTAFDYNLHDEMSWIDEQRRGVKEWLSLNAFASLDLAELASEIQGLESWFPEEQPELRRLWWYWRGDDVMRNLRVDGSASALIVTDDPDELSELRRDLGALFDLTAFAAETPFVGREPVDGFVPIPEDLDFPYVNFVYTREHPDASPK